MRRERWGEEIGEEKDTRGYRRARVQMREGTDTRGYKCAR